MCRAMLGKSLIQFSGYVCGCVPSLWFDPRPNYGKGNKDNGNLFQKAPSMQKMSSAVIVVLTTVSYMIFGVTNYTNQISDFESASAAGLITEAEKLTAIKAVVGSVEAGQSLGLLIFMTVIPCALMLISNYLYQKKYALDEVEYERICKAIEAAK